jgi:hypothetical protein
MWKEVVKVLFHHLRGSVDEKHEKLIQDSPCADRNSNKTLIKYMSQAFAASV